MIKESFVNLFQSLNHKNLSINLHFEILKNQNLLIKIQKFYESGSLKDLLFKSVIFLYFFLFQFFKSNIFYEFF